jgi:hypothetical protein
MEGCELEGDDGTWPRHGPVGRTSPAPARDAPETSACQVPWHASEHGDALMQEVQLEVEFPAVEVTVRPENAKVVTTARTSAWPRPFPHLHRLDPFAKGRVPRRRSDPAGHWRQCSRRRLRRRGGAAGGYDVVT